MPCWLRRVLCALRAVVRRLVRWLSRRAVFGAVVFGVVVAGVSVTACRHVGRHDGVVRAIEDWAYEDFRGRRIATEHFVLYSTLTDTAFEAALPGFLEAAYREYERVAPPPDGVGPPLTVYVFATRPAWVRFTRRHFPASYGVYSRIRVGGFTDGGTAVLFYAGRSQVLSTLAHEGWHAFAASRFDASLPAWLNEGLACYFEACDFVGDVPRFTPARNTFRINGLRETLQADRLLPLDELLSTDAGRVIAERHDKATERYYPQAWALVTFLRHGGGGRFASSFDRMMRDIAAGTFHTTVQAARVTLPNPGDVDDGTAVLYAYFDAGPEDIADAYYAHLVRICGF